MYTAQHLRMKIPSESHQDVCSESETRMVGLAMAKPVRQRDTAHECGRQMKLLSAKLRLQAMAKIMFLNCSDGIKTFFRDGDICQDTGVNTRDEPNI